MKIIFKTASCKPGVSYCFHENDEVLEEFQVSSGADKLIGLKGTWVPTWYKRSTISTSKVCFLSIDDRSHSQKIR